MTTEYLCAECGDVLELDCTIEYSSTRTLVYLKRCECRPNYTSDLKDSIIDEVSEAADNLVHSVACGLNRILEKPEED